VKGINEDKEDSKNKNKNKNKTKKSNYGEWGFY
jgi:hypothetical protein